jgi:D-cysteine desulfhydrase family pyridoxal phosphate-dependent enzyme
MIDTTALDNLTCALLGKPRFPLGQLPTPLDEAPRLSDRLGLRVLIKRDDQTGLALGGNKVRKLEFLIGDALASGADVVVTTGGSQSNHARLTAAACRKAGLACRLVLNRGPHNDAQGNLLLDHLLDASVHWVDSEDPADAVPAMETLAEELRAQGRKPYVVPRGGSVPQGATGYAAMIAELIPQLSALDLTPTALYLATGSGGTHSGTLAGLTATGYPLPVQGISVSRPSSLQEAKVQELSSATLRHLGFEGDVPADRVRVDDRFRGPAYGYPTGDTFEAITLVARDEAVILDPVYTGKAMAGLIGHAREGRLGPDDTVVFLHTGGSPALFAYNQELERTLEPAAP